MPIEDSKIRKISKKEEEEEETNGREIKDRRGGAKTRCRANRGTRGSRCNKASRERNTPRRQRLPLQLQSSSISRGRQIKLLTQYPLYPYNKNKYDRSSPELSSCYDFQVSLSLFFRLLHALCNEGGKKLLKRWTRLFDALLLLFLFVIIVIISRARMFTRRFEFLSKSKRRNVCYQYHNTFEIYLGYFPPRVAFIYVKYCTILPANFNK